MLFIVEISIMKIKGIVTDKNNNVIKDAIIEIKDDNFKTLYSTKSDING